MPVRPIFSAVILAAAGLLSLIPCRQARAEPAAPPAEVRTTGLHPGMTAAEVLECLGKPKYVAREILYGRYVEQWTYSAPIPVRITFEWRKGQEKQIQTVRPLTTPAH